jgi:hypothetical protein
LDQAFRIGKYRPIYLWAGPGTIRMNKVKFMDYPVDEKVHMDAHREPAAKRVVEKLYANWVHLMYDWGFPPEVEKEDWEDFRQGAAAYHKAGTPVFAYIQSSNCVFSGSFIEKNWYARNPKGQKVFYYSGRYMIDWTHPDWIQHLKDLIRGAIERGADGIFFDNLWYGEGPYSLMGTWLGGAGCYCKRCQGLYHKESGGKTIPEKIFPSNPDAADYLRWRAKRVTQTVQELADFAHSLKPDVPISANDFDVTMRNSLLIYGIDVEALAKIQDVIMVEDFALPRWTEKPTKQLPNNALTIRNTREFVKNNAHLNVLSYDVGIGFDPVYPPRRHLQGIGEAAACGASMTIKGTEYNDGQKMTLLTDPAYHEQQEAIGRYHRWLDENAALYEDRKNLAKIGLLHPEDALWQGWHTLALIYYGAAQLLTAAGLPWRVVRPGDSPDHLSVLLTFTPDAKENIPERLPNLTTVHVPDLEGWALKKPGAAAKPGLTHDLITGIGLSLVRGYHSRKLIRHLMDKMNMTSLVLQTSLFNLPEATLQETLLNALPGELSPRVTSEQPVLIEVWQKEKERQIHLMNYADRPQTVQVHFDAPVEAVVISPDREDQKAPKGQTLSLHLDIYSVLHLK